MSNSEEEKPDSHYEYVRKRYSPRSYLRVLRPFCFVIRVQIPKNCESFEEEALDWGCRDADFSIDDGVATLSFTRRAPDFSDAVYSALVNLTPVERYVISVNGSTHTVPAIKA